MAFEIYSISLRISPETERGPDLYDFSAGPLIEFLTSKPYRIEAEDFFSLGVQPTGGRYEIFWSEQLAPAVAPLGGFMIFQGTEAFEVVTDNFSIGVEPVGGSMSFQSSQEFIIAPENIIPFIIPTGGSMQSQASVFYNLYDPEFFTVGVAPTGGTLETE